MNYNFNFIPKTKRIVNDAEVLLPHIIDYPLSVFIAEQLEQRVSVVNPMLEFRVSLELREFGSVELNEEESAYIRQIIVQLQIDNLLKGQILKVLNTL